MECCSSQSAEESPLTSQALLKERVAELQRREAAVSAREASVGHREAALAILLPRLEVRNTRCCLAHRRHIPSGRPTRCAWANGYRMPAA